MINVDHLSKSFGAKQVVQGVSFVVERGQVLGFLGPNGAGKSTTMRMITGFLAPTAGTVTVAGFDVMRQPIEAKRRIGYLPESAPSYSDMSVSGFLNWAAEMRGFAGSAKKQAVQRAVDTCFLESVLEQSIDTLSKGFRHRTCLAQSIIHDPEVLILDEPTDGLDPNQKHEVRTLIRRMGETKAIIFSTHILEEVEAACTHAIIIDRGRIVANGTPEELKARSHRAGCVVMSLQGASRDAVNSALQQLPSVARFEIVAADANGVLVRVYPSSDADKGALGARVAQLALARGWSVNELHTEEGRLEDVFRSLTRADTEAERSAPLATAEVAA